MDVNKVMAEALQAGGLTCPMCEDPYQGNADGTYITWAHLSTEVRCSSGTPFMRTHRLQMNLWFDPEDRAWRMQRDAASAAIDLCLGRGTENVRGMSYALRGLEDMPDIDRKKTSMMVIIWEVM